MPGLDVNCDRRQLLALAALCALALLAGCTGTLEENRACAVCREADDLSVRATLDVHVSANGSARWIARFEPARAVDARALAATVRNESSDEDRIRPAHRGRARDVTATVVDGTAIVSYRVPGVATDRRWGLATTTTFHRAHDDGRAYRLGADVVRIHAPPGRTIANRPPGATVTNEGRTVVWRASRDAGRETRINQATYVVFGPDRSPLTRASANLLVAELTLRWGGGELVTYLFVALGPVGLVLGVFGNRVREASVDRNLGDHLRELDARQRGAIAVVVAATAFVALSLLPPRRGGLAWTRPAIGAIGTGPIVAGLLGVATARRRWYAAPLWVLIAGVTAVPAVVLAFDPSHGGWTPTVPLGWSVPLAIVGGMAFLIGARLGAGAWFSTR